jgi:hypothetical protein
MARGKPRGGNGGNAGGNAQSNGLRGYKLLRLPMVAGSPVTRRMLLADHYHGKEDMNKK